MAERIAGPEIERLIQLLGAPSRPRTALGRARAALHLIRKREELLGPAGRRLGARARYDQDVLAAAANVDTVDPCSVCQDPRRDPGRAGGGGDRGRPVGAGAGGGRARALPRARRHACPRSTASDPASFNLATLAGRVAEDGITEVILAVNATVDGQTTAHYVTDLIAHLDVRTTRLAHGVPVGGELDYLDEGTLSAALRSRNGVLRGTYGRRPTLPGDGRPGRPGLARRPRPRYLQRHVARHRTKRAM